MKNVETIISSLQASLRGELPPEPDTPPHEALIAAVRSIQGSDEALRALGVLAVGAMISHWGDALAAQRELLLLQIAIANGQPPSRH